MKKEKTLHTVKDYNDYKNQWNRDNTIKLTINLRKDDYQDILSGIKLSYGYTGFLQASIKSYNLIRALNYYELTNNKEKFDETIKEIRRIFNR